MLITPKQSDFLPLDEASREARYFWNLYPDVSNMLSNLHSTAMVFLHFPKESGNRNVSAHRIIYSQSQQTCTLTWRDVWLPGTFFVRQTGIRSPWAFFSLIFISLFVVYLVKDLQPRTTRNIPIIEHNGITAFCNKGDCTPWGTIGHLIKRFLEKNLFWGVGLC